MLDMLVLGTYWQSRMYMHSHVEGFCEVRATCLKDSKLLCGEWITLGRNGVTEEVWRHRAWWDWFCRVG